MKTEKIYDLLSKIPDPEIPVITISDLGILRDVSLKDDHVVVSITPTYSGCPAMHAIEQEIKKTLMENGVEGAEVKLVHAPAWTTDWLSEEAKEKLRVYGISPPGKVNGRNLLSGTREVACPRCGSLHVRLVSQFGSTPCKALYACKDCGEPFDQFKCH